MNNPREKRINLHFHHEPEEIILTFDREKFRLIFNNLLSNAIKYTPEGGTSQVRAGIEDHQFVLSVKDNGIGMAPEERFADEDFGASELVHALHHPNSVY